MRKLVAACVVLAACGAPPRSPIAAKPIASFEVTPPTARYADWLDQRELREQVRDWAVLGMMAHLGVTPEQAAKATYEIPPARLSYLEDLYGFDYGYGRRVYLNNRILLFDDAADPDPQLTLGRLADRVRMENGDLPSAMELYVIHGSQDASTIHVDRMPDVATADLFSSKFGYVAATVRDAASLEKWLESADDLSFAEPTADGALSLAGRRFARTRTANIALEDVAALFQAHGQLATQQKEAERRLAQLPSGPKHAVEQLLALAKDGKSNSDEAYDAEEALLDAVPDVRQRRSIQKDYSLAVSPRSPGFSLDPEWLPTPKAPGEPLMASRMRSFAADACGALNEIARLKPPRDDTRRISRDPSANFVRESLASTNDLKSTCADLQYVLGPRLEVIATSAGAVPPADWGTTLGRYHDAIALLPEDEQELASNALRFYEHDTRVQCGRYTGVDGTSVGMTMFYTDLLAKLWLIDFAMSAPVAQLPGFESLPRIKVLPEYTWGNRGTRLWFGPRPDAVSKTAAGRLMFGHRFTRVYAAGNDPLLPGFETQPNEASRRALNWFDRHFDEIADYEPQYHRLNEITKWSLVTAALLDSHSADFLRGVNVRRNLRFDSWQQQTCGLRFTERLPTVSATVPGKECVPLLSSYDYADIDGPMVMTGGVSTASADAPKHLPVVDADAPLGARRAHLDDIGAGKAGTATRATPVLEGTKVTFAHGDTVPTVAADGAVKLGKREVTYSSGASPRAFTVHIGGDDSIGTLTVQADGHMIFTEGEVELDRHVRWAEPSVDARSAARDYLAKAKARQAAEARRELEHLDLAKLDPDTIKAVADATEYVGTTAAALHVAAGADASRAVKLALRDGKIATSRDFERVTTKPIARQELSQLEDPVIYIDASLASREGFMPDFGEPIAHLYERPSITVEELTGNELGDLFPTKTNKEGERSAVELASDEIRDTTRHRTYVRSTPAYQLLLSNVTQRRVLVVRRATESEQLGKSPATKVPGVTRHCD